MKFAVQSNLPLSTPAQQDGFYNAVLVRIAGKPVWGKPNITKGLNMDGKPNHSVEIRFDQEADHLDLFNFIKARMQVIPVLSGRLSRHQCHHDEGNIPCVIEEEL